MISGHRDLMFGRRRVDTTSASTAPLRLGLLGCGFQGTHYAQCLEGHPRLQLDICCDADQDRAADLAAASGAAESTDDWRAVVEHPDLDAVIIATTTHTHAEIAVAAARAGKHIVLEKPMAITVEDCLAIERAVAEHRVCLMVGFKFRFAPAVVAARAAVTEPVVLIAQTMYDASQDTAGWVNDPALSGGRLMSSLVHSVDVLRVLAGSEPVRVSAEGGSLAIAGTTEPDNVVATIRFANGSLGSVVHGSAGRSSLLSTWSFQTIGIGQNATIHDHGRRMSLHRAGRDDPIEHVDPVSDPFQTGMRELLGAFSAAIDSGEPTGASARDGTIATLVCLQIARSMAAGRSEVVTLPA